MPGPVLSILPGLSHNSLGGGAVMNLALKRQRQGGPEASASPQNISGEEGDFADIKELLCISFR